jgi:hypothetical protein
VTLWSTGSLVRGRPAILLLTVTNPSDAATGAITATFGLPSGVTLRAADAGDGWTCGETGAIVCQKLDLAAGASSRAHVRVTIAGTAAAGVPTVTLTGPRVVTTTASAAEGITGAEIGP